jgi:hypothetical protein
MGRVVEIRLVEDDLVVDDRLGNVAGLASEERAYLAQHPSWRLQEGLCVVAGRHDDLVLVRHVDVHDVVYGVGVGAGDAIVDGDIAENIVDGIGGNFAVPCGTFTIGELEGFAYRARLHQTGPLVRTSSDARPAAVRTNSEIETSRAAAALAQRSFSSGQQRTSSRTTRPFRWSRSSSSRTFSASVGNASAVRCAARRPRTRAIHSFRSAIVIWPAFACVTARPPPGASGRPGRA